MPPAPSLARGLLPRRPPPRRARRPPWPAGTRARWCWRASRRQWTVRPRSWVVEQRRDLQRGQPVRHLDQPVAARRARPRCVALVAQRLHLLPHRGARQPELAGERLAGSEAPCPTRAAAPARAGHGSRPGDRGAPSGRGEWLSKTTTPVPRPPSTGGATWKARRRSSAVGALLVPSSSAVRTRTIPTPAAKVTRLTRRRPGVFGSASVRLSTSRQSGKLARGRLAGSVNRDDPVVLGGPRGHHAGPGRTHGEWLVEEVAHLVAHPLPVHPEGPAVPVDVAAVAEGDHLHPAGGAFAQVGRLVGPGVADREREVPGRVRKLRGAGGRCGGRGRWRGLVRAPGQPSGEHTPAREGHRGCPPGARLAFLDGPAGPVRRPCRSISSSAWRAASRTAG